MTPRVVAVVVTDAVVASVVMNDARSAHGSATTVQVFTVGVVPLPHV